MKLILCILVAFLLAACSANNDMQTSSSIPSPESAVISNTLNSSEPDGQPSPVLVPSLPPVPEEADSNPEPEPAVSSAPFIWADDTTIMITGLQVQSVDSSYLHVNLTLQNKSDQTVTYGHHVDLEQITAEGAVLLQFEEKIDEVNSADPFILTPGESSVLATVVPLYWERAALGDRYQLRMSFGFRENRDQRITVVYPFTFDREMDRMNPVRLKAELEERSKDPLISQFEITGYEADHASITITLLNAGNDPITYGPNPDLYCLLDGQWVPVDFKPEDVPVFPAVIEQLQPGQIIKIQAGIPLYWENALVGNQYKVVMYNWVSEMSGVQGELNLEFYFSYDENMRDKV